MGKIISFAGRCRSGKTELSNICEKYGYKKLYFALPLKQLCADMLNVSIDKLNKLKTNGTDINLTLNADACAFLNERTNIPLDKTLEICNDKHLSNVREMLQFIGTDYIRTCNPNWHVDKIKQMIDDNNNYVIDDVRFPNEKRMIEELGGDCWFVTRTTLDNISNHPSETSILWKDCWNKVIINNSTLHEFLFKWEVFMRNYEVSCELREKEFNRALEEGFDDLIHPFSVIGVLLSPHLFSYYPMDISRDDIEKISMNEDKSVFVTYKNGSTEMVTNPLIIEDLKIFL